MRVTPSAIGLTSSLWSAQSTQGTSVKALQRMRLAKQAAGLLTRTACGPSSAAASQKPGGDKRLCERAKDTQVTASRRNRRAAPPTDQAHTALCSVLGRIPCPTRGLLDRAGHTQQQRPDMNNRTGLQSTTCTFQRDRVTLPGEEVTEWTQYSQFTSLRNFIHTVLLV